MSFSNVSLWGFTPGRSGTTTYSYDSLDRPTEKATPEGTLSYGYDAASNVASVSSNHAHGISVSYAYDELNRLSTVTDGRLQGNQTTTYSYDPASNVAGVSYANGVQSTLTYDALNRISALATQATSYSYSRGPTGNLTGASEGGGRTLSWTYDGIYRLTNETISGDPAHNNGSSSYSLDVCGWGYPRKKTTRNGISKSGLTTSLKPPRQNQLVARKCERSVRRIAGKAFNSGRATDKARCGDAQDYACRGRGAMTTDRVTISNRETAEKVCHLMDELFRRVEESVLLVRETCEPNEAEVFQRVAGRIAMPILMDVLGPLYDDYPTLKPLDWED